MLRIKSVLVFTILLSLTKDMYSQSWSYITSSDEYYYGVGSAATEAEADKQAMADLIQMISVHVSSDFYAVDNVTQINDKIDQQTYATNCVKTYSSSTLTNVKKMPVEGKEPNIVVKRYMEKSELDKIFEQRRQKVRDMVSIGDGAISQGKVGMALQYYYWAYSLVRSLQFPTEMKDNEGRSLITILPVKIRSIIEDVNVKFLGRDGDCVDLAFTYRNTPLSGLDFTYSDGRVECEGMAKDGMGMIEMSPGTENDYYHLNIEYEYKNLARGDEELSAVLNVVPKEIFPKSHIVVKGGSANVASTASRPSVVPSKQEPSMPSTDAVSNFDPKVIEDSYSARPRAEQLAVHAEEYLPIMEKVLEAIRKRNYLSASSCFTLDGLGVFNDLITQTKGRIVGKPDLMFYKGIKGYTIVRGLQMTFSFTSVGKKKTFVEDVIFTFDENKKICNVAFGLGKIAENDILLRYAPGWKDDTREMIMEFLENYKTAYCLKRIDYISDVFADDAVIIVGNVAKRTFRSADVENNMSVGGQDIISYNRYDKDTYIKHLRQTFARNEFINIRFTNNEVQWLEKYKDQEIFGIQIGQEYTSSRYADKGYLFLLVDMTDHDNPQIKIRTWQPNEVSMDNVFNAGHFYND